MNDKAKAAMLRMIAFHLVGVKTLIPCAWCEPLETAYNVLLGNANRLDGPSCGG